MTKQICVNKYSFFLLLFVALTSVLLSCNNSKESIDVFSASWEEIVEEAKGEKVYFNAWGGSNTTNEYISWVKEKVKQKYGIDLVHVLIQDTLEVTRRIQQEKTANNLDDGSVDLIWLNGNAFNILKQQNLFLGNIYDLLPNNKYINSNNPVLFEDFTVPTDGLEVPWGNAQLTFYYKKDKVSPFHSLDELKRIVRKHDGVFTYPNPTLDFTGRTFLKNLVYHFAQDKEVFYAPFEDTLGHRSIIQNNQVWKFLDSIHPKLWSEGRVFPNNVSELVTYFKDGEIDYGIAFNPYFPLNQVLKGEFPDTVRTFLLKEGTVANAHFLTIPFNASSKAAALVVIDFLISPQAQARKANPEYWGDATVLDLSKVNISERKEFEKIATAKHHSGPPSDLGENTVKEFHSTWEKPLQEFWKQRYLR